jgi:hypothetical protein
VAQTLIALHWGVRYIVLLTGALALVVAAVRLRTGTMGRAGRIAGAALTGALDFQAALGIGLLLTRPFYPALMGHLTMMVLALVVMHTTMIVLRRRPPERQSAAVLLAGIITSLVLVVGGILAIGRSVV